MMTLMAQLCALCAMCALMQLALGDTRCADALGMIGGLLMLHLVISGGSGLCAELGVQRDLGRIFDLLMQ